MARRPERAEPGLGLLAALVAGLGAAVARHMAAVAGSTFPSMCRERCGHWAGDDAIGETTTVRSPGNRRSLLAPSYPFYGAA